jgi:hypothetical protein
MPATSAEVRLSAARAGIVDLDALKLADISALKVDAATGDIAGVDELIAALKTARPYLFKDVPAGSSHPGAPPKPAPANKFDARVAEPKEIAAEAKRLGITIKQN